MAPSHSFYRELFSHLIFLLPCLGPLLSLHIFSMYDLIDTHTFKWYQYSVDSHIYMFNVDFSLDLLTYIFNYLLDFLIQMFHRNFILTHLRLNS